MEKQDNETPENTFSHDSAASLRIGRWHKTSTLLLLLLLFLGVSLPNNPAINVVFTALLGGPLLVLIGEWAYKALSTHY